MNLIQVLLIYVIGIVVMLYFMVILPGKRKHKQTRAMHDSVTVGDEITTIGGIYGTVLSREGEAVTILVDPKTGGTLRIVIYAVQSIVKKTDSTGTSKPES